MFQQLPIKLNIDELKLFETKHLLEKQIGKDLWIVDVKEQLIGGIGQSLISLGANEIKLLDLHPGDTRILIRLSSDTNVGEVSATISFTPKGLSNV